MTQRSHDNRAGACRPGPPAAPGPRRDKPGRHGPARLRSGFTLIEVLAAMLLIGIVLPVVMQAITSASRAATASHRRAEAATLAQSKLQELTATGLWASGNLSGDFGADWPAYKWSAAVAEWANDAQGVGMQQLDVTVTWTDGGRPASLSVSSLVYARPVPAS